MSYDELSEKILENNQDIKFETVINTQRKKLLEGKKGNHVSFYVNAEDYIPDKSNKKVICVKCTDEFFNIFFKDVKDDNDEFMGEIFKLKVYMKYFPQEKLYRCTRNPEHIEILRDPQIEDKTEKRLLGAGIENYPEYGSYLDPNVVTGDFILTANAGKRKTQRSKTQFFKEESEQEIWDHFMSSKR